jgi:hypothetical protein
MKRNKLLTTIIIALAVLVLATPVAADGHAPIGDRIGFWMGSYVDFPAGTSFNIRHGWQQFSGDGAIGIFSFSLELDGVPVTNFYRDFSEVSGDPDTLIRLWVYNFPAGMSGEHTFTGHWYAPCQYAVNELEYVGSCANPNQQVETSSRTLTVKFVP